MRVTETTRTRTARRQRVTKLPSHAQTNTFPFEILEVFVLCGSLTKVMCWIRWACLSWPVILEVYMFKISKCHNKTKRTIVWSVLIDKNMPMKSQKYGQLAETHIILHQHHVLPQRECWQFWQYQPRGHQQTSHAQRQNFWGSGRTLWCRSPGKLHFPSACIPWVGKD